MGFTSGFKGLSYTISVPYYKTHTAIYTEHNSM